jgi:hypothetical protein
MARALFYLGAVAGGLLFAALVWVGLVLCQLGAPTESSRWSHELYERKQQLAPGLASPKLVIVAGSNGLFNLSAERLTQTGLPTLNYSSHAGLGLEYILWQAQKVLTRGDTVLLPLEYALYTETGSPSEVLLDHVFARDKTFFSALPLGRKIHYVFALSPQRLYQGLKARLRPPEPDLQGYQAKNLNAYGDETTHTATLALKVDRLEPVSSLREGKEVSQVSAALLRDFITWARIHDIQVLATFPATAYFEVYAEDKAKYATDAVLEFYKTQSVPVLGSPEDFMYSHQFIFDTGYHLNLQGTARNTEKTLELLRDFLGEKTNREP